MARASARITVWTVREDGFRIRPSGRTQRTPRPHRKLGLSTPASPPDGEGLGRSGAFAPGQFHRLTTIDVDGRPFASADLERGGAAIRDVRRLHAGIDFDDAAIEPGGDATRRRHRVPDDHGPGMRFRE